MSSMPEAAVGARVGLGLGRAVVARVADARVRELGVDVAERAVAVRGAARERVARRVRARDPANARRARARTTATKDP